MMGTTANLWGSTATFRRCRAEKVSFVLLNQLDLFLTVTALSLGLFEVNPLMRYLITVPVLLLMIKFVIPLLIAWLVPGKLLLPASALLVLVIAWNVKEMLLLMQ